MNKSVVASDFLGQFKSRRFSRTEEDEKSRRRKRFEMFLFWRHRFDEKVLAGAVSAFSI